jgi:hypothetical protein
LASSLFTSTRDTALTPAMPLFTNHTTMNIDARRTCCRYLHGPKKCPKGQNKDRLYVSVSTYFLHLAVSKLLYYAIFKGHHQDLLAQLFGRRAKARVRFQNTTVRIWELEEEYEYE